MTYQNDLYDDYEEEVKLSDIIIPKYYNIVNDRKHTHVILSSGRAGTKSSFMGIDSIYDILAIENTAIVIMRKFHNKLYKTVYQEVVRALHRLGLDEKDFIIHKSPMEITYKENGNVIIFTGSDSIDDTKGIISKDRKIRMVVMDELTEFFDSGEGEDEINNIVATFIRGNNDYFRMMYLFNPPKNPKAPIMQWVKKMEMRDDCIHIHSDYRDVPVEWLGQKLIDEALAMKAVDERMYNWVWLGQPIGLDDLIYYMFNESRNVTSEKIPLTIQQIIIGVDYGQMNATTFQAFGIDFKNKKFRGLKEFYHSGRETGKQKSPSDYAKEFEKMLHEIYSEIGRKPVRVCIDPSAKGLSEEIKRRCPECIFPSVDNTVKLGITRVQKCLSFAVLEIDHSQIHLIEEMGLYAYDEKSIENGDEKPIKTNDHCQDALRYAVMDAWKLLIAIMPILASDEKKE